MSLDNAMTRWNGTKSDLAKFQKNNFSETDIRCKIIDPFLKTVFGWDEESITREPHTDVGFIDYFICGQKNKFVVEAKKGGTFDIPKGKLIVKSANLMKTSRNLFDAIEQARRYAKQKNTFLCVTSNGLQIAISLTYPNVNKPDTLLLNGPEVITENFFVLYNIISPYNNGHQKLEEYLASNQEYRQSPIFSQSIREALTYTHMHQNRNLLDSRLRPIIETYFGDITDDERKLDKLYCNTEQHSSYAKQIQQYLRERNRATGYQIEHIEVQNQTAGAFSHTFKSHSYYNTRENGHVFLILGTLGAGKSTFIRRFYSHILDEFMRKSLIWIVFDFLLLVEKENKDVNKFINEIVERELVNEAKKKDIKIKQWEVTKEIYADIVEELTEDIFSVYEGIELEQKLSEEIRKRRADNPQDYWARLIRYIRVKHQIDVCFVMDNVDQLSSELQTDVTMRCFQLAKQYKMLVIATLRDETFWAMRSTLPGDAYKPSTYQIVPPTASQMIRRRLHTTRIEQSNSQIIYQDNPKLTFQLHDFLEGIENTLKNEDTDIFGQFSGGNMRLSLDLFNSYLVSPNIDWRFYMEKLTKAPSLLRQEVIQSLGLGDFKFYDSTKTKILNLFTLDNDGFYSHFTHLRILEVLQARRNREENYQLGKGFVSIQELLASLKPYCVDEEKLRKKLIPLLQYYLVDSDIGSRKMNDNNHHNEIKFVKLTPTGSFYIESLIFSPMYLYLIAMDTPVTESRRFTSMLGKQRRIIENEVKWKGAWHIKYELVELFLEYLINIEEAEFSYLGNLDMAGKFVKVMPEVMKGYFAEKNVIGERFKTQGAILK